jgi:glycosyltransferase involved in cell wall biosynthesis
MSNAAFAREYGAPVADPDAPVPVLRWPRRGEGRLGELRGLARRRTRGRRLAYVDSHFPWRRSGFRYGDALALLDARPDTVFFSMYETTDPFPKRVLPLADFPRLAPALGITDVYGVFLDFTAGLLGVPRPAGQGTSPIDGIDLSGVLRRHGIRLHANLYPGGGLVRTEASLARAGAVVRAAHQVFSYVPEVLERFPEVTPLLPALVDCGFYAHEAPDLTRRPAEVLFVAAAKQRKGLDVALAMQAHLDVRVHVVGPHDPAADPAAVFHGRLDRDELRALHHRVPIFVSPVRAEQPGEGDGGIVDGFPTTAAAEAMSSGCLLVSANPGNDHRVLRPGVDYLERPATPEAFAAAVRWAFEHPAEAAAIAASGSARVHERMDIRQDARRRLRLMDLI